MSGPDAPIPDLDANATALLGSLPDPVVVVSTTGVLLWGNDIAESLFGWSKQELVGSDVTVLVHPDDLNTALVSLASVQDKDAGTLIEIRIRDHSGLFRRVEIRGRVAELGGAECVVLGLRDLTDRRRWELGAGDQAAASAVLDLLPSIALVLTPEGHIRSANRAFTRLLGHPLEGVLGRPLTDFVSVARVLAVSEALMSVTDGRGRIGFEAELVDVDGETHPMSMTVVDLVDDGAVQGLVAAAADIAALAAARDRLAHAATHDSLTGLPNRAALQERLKAALSNAAIRGVRVGVVFVDVDQFGVVNESHGHRVGDAALIEVGQRLGGALRGSDLVARYGGDEFVLVASGIDQAALDRLVDRIAWLMRSAIEVDLGPGRPPVEIRLSVAVGSVLVPPGDDAAAAIEAADADMQRHRVRHRHRNV